MNCHSCGSCENLHLCLCKKVSYCNKICQGKDWKGHKCECLKEIVRKSFEIQKEEQNPTKYQIFFHMYNNVMKIIFGKYIRRYNLSTFIEDQFKDLSSINIKNVLCYYQQMVTELQAKIQDNQLLGMLRIYFSNYIFLIDGNYMYDSKEKLLEYQEVLSNVIGKNIDYKCLEITSDEGRKIRMFQDASHEDLMRKLPDGFEDMARNMLNSDKEKIVSILDRTIFKSLSKDKCLLIKANGEFSLLDLPKDKSNYSELNKFFDIHLECRTVQLVRMRSEPTIEIYLDDCGKINKSPINKLASHLFDIEKNLPHDSGLHGNVLFILRGSIP